MHVIGLGASMQKSSVQASVIQVLNIIFSHLVSILIRSSADHRAISRLPPQTLLARGARARGMKPIWVPP